MTKNKDKTTQAFCFEDFIKYYIVSNENDLSISNIVLPELVEKFIEMAELFGIKLNITIFNHREYDPEFVENYIKIAVLILN